jgi:hypothetical protein
VVCWVFDIMKEQIDWEESQLGVIDKHCHGSDVFMDGYVNGVLKYTAGGYKLGAEPIEIDEESIEEI